MSNKVFGVLTILSALFFSTKSEAQTQEKKFWVNAVKFGDIPGAPLCDGFEVVISAEEINIGDDFSLAIISSDRDQEKNLTLYRVKDKAVEENICAIRHGVSSSGDNYLVCFRCDEKGNPNESYQVKFYYWNYVSDYALWRLGRK